MCRRHHRDLWHYESNRLWIKYLKEPGCKSTKSVEASKDSDHWIISCTVSGSPHTTNRSKLLKRRQARAAILDGWKDVRWRGWGTGTRNSEWMLGHQKRHSSSNLVIFCKLSLVLFPSAICKFCWASSRFQSIMLGWFKWFHGGSNRFALVPISIVFISTVSF